MSAFQIKPGPRRELSQYQCYLVATHSALSHDLMIGVITQKEQRNLESLRRRVRKMLADTGISVYIGNKRLKP